MTNITINLLCTYYLHGLDGRQEDFQAIKDKVEETFTSLFNTNVDDNETVNGEEGHEDKIINHNFGYCSYTNAEKKSHEAFPVLTERSFKELQVFLEDNVLNQCQKEVEEEKEKNINNPEGGEEEVKYHYQLYFSIAGHSLGGLILRGVVQHIYLPFQKDGITYDSYFDYLQQRYATFLKAIIPCSMVMLSAPHLGVMLRSESGQLGPRIFQHISKFFCKYLAGDIGKMFIYRDASSNNGGKPTIIQLNDPASIKAYAHFPNRTLMGCIRYDMPVKFSSAMGSIDQPIREFEKNGAMVEGGKVDTRMLFYSGYEEGAELEYYQKELFNEKISKGLFYSTTTQHRPNPNIDEQIREGLEKLQSKKKYKKEDFANQKYEEMDQVFIPDAINQIETSVSALKLFNQLSYRRVGIDFCLPKMSRPATHPVYMGNMVTKSTPVVEDIVSRTVQFISNMIVADYVLTSHQHTTYSLNDLLK